MPEFSIQPSKRAHRQHCNCCDKDQITVWGLVDRDGAGHAVYYGYMHVQDAGEPERILSLTICMGDWGNDPGAAANRHYIHLKVRHDLQMMIRDADESLVFGKDFLGRPMSRDEALTSPLKDDFFAVADFVVSNDPAIRSFLSGSAIDLIGRNEN